MIVVRMAQCPAPCRNGVIVGKSFNLWSLGFLKCSLTVSSYLSFWALTRGHSFSPRPPLVLEGVDIKESGRASRVVEEDP